MDDFAYLGVAAVLLMVASAAVAGGVLVLGLSL